MRHSTSKVVFLLAIQVIGGAGCLTNPQPEPIPLAPNVERMYLSEDYGTVAGLPGAAEFSEDPETPSEIFARNLQTNATASAIVAYDGSFLVDLDADLYDQIDVWLQQGDRVSQTVTLLRPTSMPATVPLEVYGVEALSEDQARVTGNGGEGMLVIVGNEDRRWVASTTIDPSDEWEVIIDAQQGEWLIVFFVETGSRVSIPGDRLQVPAI